VTIDYIGDRERMLSAIREEFVGPAPYGPTLDISDHMLLESIEKSYGPYRTASGQEILCWENPITRYGVGVLFPLEQAEGDEAPTTDEETQEREAETLAGAPEELVDDNARAKVNGMQDKASRRDDDPGEFDLSSAHARRPSSLGVSVLLELDAKDSVEVSATGGRYHVLRVRVADRAQERRWFVRSAWSLRGSFDARDLLSSGRRALQVPGPDREGLDDLDIRIEAFTRPISDSRALVTVTLVNRTKGQPVDIAALFQCDLRIEVKRSGTVVAAILPYPGADYTKLDQEEQSLGLLYRKWQAFAIGHGCAAEWTLASEGRASQVRGNILPVVETASITPDITDGGGRPVRVRMAALAGLLKEDDGRASLDHLLGAYGQWLNERDDEAALLTGEWKVVAQRHIALGRRALERMRGGLQLLTDDPQIGHAFRLANHAVLLQQLHGERESRRVTGKKAGGGYEFSRARANPDLAAPQTDRGYWRAFQIAFLLMVLESSANAQSLERELVELIWFPTGGGKTEAYLGLTAFMIFLRRLRAPDDTGVEVLTRYTLRLLTTQQFQRAAALICAMETLRRIDERGLGATPFAIGIWLGGATTPNRRSVALKNLITLQTRDDAENPFLVTQCPWCAAQIGQLDSGARRKGATRIAGYSQSGPTVAINCPDATCDFARGLPVYVIDDDIYEKRPDLLIGTVDKFAQLPWVPQARSIFGLDQDGQRLSSPPGLIIQDELHLISGPLGSLVGLYELAINELCTDRRRGVQVPKIVTSTATIRRYEQQLLALYARPRATLFPPPGLDISDSFFARYAEPREGEAPHGRWYVGVHASNHRSLITTQVQSMAALLQAPMRLERAAADPWWTLMVFFNNLRELGTSLSLLQANIPMHLKAIGNRQGPVARPLRRIVNPLELTSRIQNDEVPEVMAALDVKSTSTNPWPVDVCLASNIIEVGIDIERLSLMLVVGQPKSTSQYIQVTGRVGRKWWERPGLIVTLLNPARPRDRSHYEQFKAYHERLYAQVEPTSVTPFSPPAIERALHAVLASVLRQSGDRTSTERPTAVTPDALARFGEMLASRVAAVDPDEAESVMGVFARRSEELRRWRRPRWGGYAETDMDSVMLSAPDSELLRALTLFSWPTPLSMRNVDAECELDITSKYFLEEPVQP
jgi:hypothetical protein